MLSGSESCWNSIAGWFVKGKKMGKNPDENVNETRAAQARTHSDQAATQAEQANTRTNQAETRKAQAVTQSAQAKTQTEQAATQTEQTDTRTDQAETKSEQAKTRTAQAETQTAQANTRLAQAETKTEQARTRAAQAETRNEQANTQTAQAATRTEQARTWLAEKDLRVSELSYRRLFEAALDGILILDVATGRILDVNPYLFNLLGFSRAEMVGKTVGEISPFKDLVSNQTMLEQLQKDGYVRYEDLPLETKDGRKIAVEFVSNVYQAGEEKVIQCNIRNITERKKAEAVSSLLAAIVASSDDAIIGKDMQGGITSWNRGAEKVFGYTASEMVGTSILRLLPLDRLAEEDQILEKIARGESVQHFETLRLTKDGRLIDVSVTASPIKDATGKAIGVSKVVRDISQRKQVEESLRVSAAEFRTLAETMPQIVWVTNAAGENIYFNQRWMDYTGLSLAESLGAGWNEPFHPDDRQRAWEAWQKAVVGTGDYSLECRLRRADGVYRWWWILGAPFKAADGTILKWFGTCTDITERKLAENVLLESKRFLQSTLDALSSHIAILDEHGTIIEVNTAWDRFARENHFVGSHGMGDNYLRVCNSAIGDFCDEAPTVAGGIQAVMAGRQNEFHLEYPCHSLRERRWFLVRATRFAGDGPVRIVVAHENITERKLSEAEALWKTTLLEAQLDSSPDGILVVDNHGNQLLQNRRMIELWKIPADIVADKNETVQIAFATKQTTNPQKFVERVKYLYTHPDAVGQDEIELKDGTILDRYSAPIRDLAKKNYGRIWSFRDITQSRKLQQQFNQAQKMESIGLLAGGIAHDFNNILAAIIGNIYLAKIEAERNPVLNEYLGEISNATKRAADLVAQILTFSRQKKTEREVVKLNHVVLEALKLLRASVPSTIRIQTELTETPTVLADTTAIHQLIMNLGTNAWHAMRDQQGILKVEMGVMEVGEDLAKTRPDLHPGRYVRLSVSDTGCGMDQATAKRIFEPFFTTKGVGEGTGLGLAVVHGIMKSHDGDITVYSQPGEGTVFHLYFPVFETETILREIAETPIPRGNGEHILFVDDEAALANLGKRMLERLGYQVTVKTSALEALAAVRAQPEEFALVITDLTMPVMDGAKLGRQLLQLQPQLRMILTTGYSGLMTNQKVLELGFQELLNKPSTGRTLGETVHRVLLKNP